MKARTRKVIPERKKCRISGERLVELFTLGELCVSDFIPQDSETNQRPIELKLSLAPKSGLVQLSHTTPSDEMYAKYWYQSATTATMREELKEIATTASRLIKMKKGDVFVDIGANDGTLLSFLDKALIRVGFEPAKNGYVEKAKKHAHLIINDFFNYKAFKRSRFGNKKARAITSIAMFYDLEDPHQFVEDVEKILDDEGLWIIQMSYLPLMLKQLAFDNICHEHLEYYSLASLKYLLDQHGFKIVDCELNDINGGSFRIYIRKAKADPARFASSPYRDVAEYRINSTFAMEKTMRLATPATYRKFFGDIKRLKKQTVDFIKKEKARGKKIWGYGASTKGNTLLQWYGLDNTLIDGIAERSEQKYEHKTVGTNIPITSEDEMRKAKPDYLLVLPWHFINEFKEREATFLERGGKFIVPCPRFEIISR